MLTEDDLAAKVAQAFGEQASRRTHATIDAAEIFRRGRRRRHRQLAAGAASVTAVVGLVAGLLITGSGPTAPTPVAQSPTHRASATPTNSTQPKHGQLPGNTLLDAAVAPMLPAAVADAGMPRYYVLSPDSGEGTVLQVRDSATGKVISTVTPPAACDMKTYTIAAAGNDRDFVAGCETGESISFYRLRITSDGSVSSLTPLAVPSPPDALGDMALTADGSKLAISFQGLHGKQGELEVVTLATGAVRTWTGGAFGLSWAKDGRELGFTTGQAKGGLYVLDVNAPGRSTLSAARLVLPRKVGSDLVGNAMLSPSGKTIIAEVGFQNENSLHLNRDSVIGGIVEISVQTGKPIRTLLAKTPAFDKVGGLFTTSCQLGAIDPTGNHVLLSCNQFGRLDRGRFTALPGVPYVTFFSAAW